MRARSLGSSVIGSGLMLGLGDASQTVWVCCLRGAGLGLNAGLGFGTGVIVVGMVGIGCGCCLSPTSSTRALRGQVVPTVSLIKLALHWWSSNGGIGPRACAESLSWFHSSTEARWARIAECAEEQALLISSS